MEAKDTSTQPIDTTQPIEEPSEPEILFTGPGGVDLIEDGPVLSQEELIFENCFYGRYQMVPEKERKKLCDIIAKEGGIELEQEGGNQKLESQFTEFSEKMEECRGCDRKPIV